MKPKQSKITAIHGGDWYETSADYLILPEGMDFEAEKAAHDKWHRDCYVPLYHSGKRLRYVGLVEWLCERGATKPTTDQLEVVFDE